LRRGRTQLVGRAHEYGLAILGCTMSPMGHPKVRCGGRRGALIQVK
jgi:hypothetical protein